MTRGGGCNLQLVAELRRLAAAERCTPAQPALAWILSRGTSIVPIAGTSYRRWVEENAGASDIKISAATQGALAEIFPPGAAAGARYPEVFGRTLGLRSEVSWHARGKMGLGFSPAPNSPGYRG